MGNILQKAVKEINIKNIFTNLLLLSHKFPIYHKLLIYRIALVDFNFTTDFTWRILVKPFMTEAVII